MAGYSLIRQILAGEMTIRFLPAMSLCYGKKRVEFSRAVPKTVVGNRKPGFDNMTLLYVICRGYDMKGRASGIGMVLA